LPYILRTVGTQSQAMSVALQCAIFILSMLAIAFEFMRYVAGSTSEPCLVSPPHYR